jgi:glycosyltransferase involved in cell wall biosynthesis
MQQPIYFEVNPFVQQKVTGVGRITARLVNALARQVPLRLVTTIQKERAVRQKLRQELLCGDEIAVDHTNVPAPDRDITAWRDRLLQLPRQRHNPVHASQCVGVYTFFRPPVRHFRREVGILYDYSPTIVPWTHTLEMRYEFAGYNLHACRLFEKAIAISESAKTDASWICPMPNDDIVVAYPGPSQCVDSHDYPGEVSRRTDVVFAVSTLEPRKNMQFLVDWFLNTSVLPARMELWWAGPSGWIFDLEKLRKKGVHRRKIRFLGMVSDAELCKLFRQATFTVYPSLYEGFGLPVLDSLLHGTRVLTSYNSSLVEFEGPGVFYFDPYDPSSVDAAYREMMESSDCEVNRPDLRQKCSWDNVARTVLSLCA